MAEDPFRARLRVAELVGALASGASGEPGELSAVRDPRLGATLGVTRHDARSDPAEVILMSGRSQGLFDAPDERRVVVVDHAEAIQDPAALAAFPPETSLVLLSHERLPARRRAARARGRTAEPSGPSDLGEAVTGAGGRIERIGRLPAEQLPAWIAARARLAQVELAPDAVAELATAVGADTDRLEQELAKLAAFSRGERVTRDDVRALVPGAIETEVFDLTRAVVRKDARAATALLERLLEEGQAPQQILALLVWQFRILLFASAMRTNADAERMARAIRSSPGAISRWQRDAVRVSRAAVTRAYESLYATDLAIKQGRLEPEAALMLCVLDLCGVASADVRDLIKGEPPKR